MSKKREVLSQFKRYVPLELHEKLKERVSELNYPRLENLVVIIDLISRKNIFFKNEAQKQYGFADIPLTAFKELLPSSDNLQADMKFLIQNKFIIRNEYYDYVKEFKAKSYKIPREYLGKPVPVMISNKNINKRIQAQLKAYQKRKVKNLEFQKTEYFKNLKVDIVEARKAIREKTIAELQELNVKRNLNLSTQDLDDVIEFKNDFVKNRFRMSIADESNTMDHILHRHMSHTMTVNAIHDGFLFFKRNKTNGRLDTNITTLPSFLRKFIVSSEPLMSIDIRNSQPYFLYTVLKGASVKTEELQKYGDLVVRGELYDFLLDEFNKVVKWPRRRDQIKEMVMKIFYSQNASFAKYKAFFGSHFPGIMKYVNETNAKDNATLSNMLTNIESHAVLDVIMKQLEKLGIRPYTIHDCLLCKESEAATIKEVFTSSLTELHGAVPTLKIDYIDKVEEAPVLNPVNESEDDWWESGTDWSEEIDQESKYIEIPERRIA